MAGTRFRMKGGKALSGTVQVPGAKNAALKQIAATLLTEETVVLSNMPRIADVERMLLIVEKLGATVEPDWEAHTVRITAKEVNPHNLPTDDVRALRASIVLLGPMLLRCGEVTMPYPGGDKIGARPISAHIRGLQQLGAKVEKDGNRLKAYVPKEGLRAGRVVLPEFSVTATENVLMAAAGIPGETILSVAAVEPHVQDLGVLLTKMGAKTELIAPNKYRISGNATLTGTEHSIVGDVLDAFTMLAAGLVTRGEVQVEGVDPEQLELPLLRLADMGVAVERLENGLKTVQGSGTLRAANVQAMPYPGVPSDLQPLFALLMTQADGTSIIHDPLYENRFRYLEELSRMGADATMLDPHRAVIKGPTLLTGIPITSFDIRAGAVLVLAGLVAEGETTIDGVDHIDRGYEAIDARLKSLGANIERIES